MTLYIKGDIHGDPIKDLSFKNNCDMRKLNENDILFICGDFGIPFGIKGPYFKKEQDLYNANWLNRQKYTTIAIAGNHDDRDAIAEMPIVEKWGGKVRQLSFCGITFSNIYYVDTPQILDIQGNHILIIPGAECHDIQDGVLDPEDKGFEQTYRRWIKDWNKMFRVKHWSYWENEAIDIGAAYALLDDGHWDDHFDMVLTHDCPTLFYRCFYPNAGTFYEETEGEKFLDSMRRVLDFEVWCHGHMHETRRYHKKEYKEIPVGNELKKELMYDGDERVWVLYHEVMRKVAGGIEPLWNIN